MPHVSSGGGGDDLGSTDEVKVFKDEGEDEKRSENLTEEKSSLIDLTESEEKTGGGQSYSSGKHASRPDLSPVYGKLEPTPHTSSFNMGYLVSPYSYHNGAAGPIPVSMETSSHCVKDEDFELQTSPRSRHSLVDTFKTCTMAVILRDLVTRPAQIVEMALKG
ncbi:protein pangolin, isoforms A/H/I/S-like [Thrips palmi]|uniref:Protein pangolin, isoforms A/H/I/S-like n=1 Tax=Thrips palmi TaxID=161013 RepID=A0A6P8ZBB8_THRPL|nr:protein pangolin, isoforms A/H/I/S-like [Thrips palmi]